MKILKETGGYLDKQAKIYKIISYVFIIIGIIALISAFNSSNYFLIIVILAIIIEISGFFLTDTLII